MISCCSYYTNIVVSNTLQTSIYIGLSTIKKRLTKCCVEGGSIQTMGANISDKSSICKLAGKVKQIYI